MDRKPVIRQIRSVAPVAPLDVALTRLAPLSVEKRVKVGDSSAARPMLTCREVMLAHESAADLHIFALKPAKSSVGRRRGKEPASKCRSPSPRILVSSCQRVL